MGLFSRFRNPAPRIQEAIDRAPTPRFARPTTFAFRSDPMLVRSAVDIDDLHALYQQTPIELRTELLTSMSDGSTNDPARTNIDDDSYEMIARRWIAALEDDPRPESALARGYELSADTSEDAARGFGHYLAQAREQFTDAADVTPLVQWQSGLALDRDEAFALAARRRAQAPWHYSSMEALPRCVGERWDYFTAVEDMTFGEADEEVFEDETVQQLLTDSYAELFQSGAQHSAPERQVFHLSMFMWGGNKADLDELAFDAMLRLNGQVNCWVWGELEEEDPIENFTDVRNYLIEEFIDQMPTNV
ncbi:hypothetical protein BSZ39_09970 [Bowdeniella nasicola]|uniref:Uncharacterized protein n=1 Tax=Bowdeniella nasicola TaxID=208480 RepID=A0A1Q5Q0W4_9ACTO|nr:hypothetical protein [Bowdeniella nasicola]OKL53349.1 hypothetical protein BSZ39_09970 [Bowdeniella nasicola]